MGELVASVSTMAGAAVGGWEEEGDGITLDRPEAVPPPPRPIVSPGGRARRSAILVSLALGAVGGGFDHFLLSLPTWDFLYGFVVLVIAVLAVVVATIMAVGRRPLAQHRRVLAAAFIGSMIGLALGPNDKFNVPGTVTVQQGAARIGSGPGTCTWEWGAKTVRAVTDLSVPLPDDPLFAAGVAYTGASRAMVAKGIDLEPGTAVLWYGSVDVPDYATSLVAGKEGPANGRDGRLVLDPADREIVITWSCSGAP